MPTLSPFTPGGSAPLSVSNTSGNVAIPKASRGQVVVFNSGANTAYIAIGDVNVTATTSSYPIAAGSKEAITFGTATYLAAITASSTTTLTITAGDGFLDGFGGGSSGGGGGGAVTVADGADVTLGAIADAAATAGGTGTVSAKLRTLTSAVHTEDAAGASGDLGVGALFVRTPVTPTAQTSADGDYGFPALDQFGDVKSLITDSTGTPVTYLAPGQAVMASSVPVVIASNQSTLTTQQAGFSFTNITTSTTTTIKSGAGVLHLVNINADGTVASATTVYDSLTGSGTKIATINSLALSGAFVYDVAFSIGLTVVTTGTSPPDVTVSWR